MVQLHRIAAFLCAWAASTSALAPANPHGWDDTQPDGSPTGRLYLKGRPDQHVHIVDQHQHPVVVDDEGWYVYGSPNNKKSALRQPRRKLWIPTSYRVSPDSVPPRHLQEEDSAHQFDFLPEPPERDFLCEGQERTLWCQDNPPYATARSGGRINPPQTQGTTKTIVILVRFSDHADRPMPSKQDLDFFFNTPGEDEVLAPTGTLKEFFRKQSFGKYSVEAHVQDWVTVSQTESYYSHGKYGVTSAFAECGYDTLSKMDAAGVDWSQYDQDGDGVLDSVVILHSGFVAEGGGKDCVNDKPHGDWRIWSHATSVPDDMDAWTSEDRSVRIGRYSATSAVRGTCGSDIVRIGVVGHEMLHMLSLPDLLGRNGTGVGLFDVMGMMWGADGSQLYPATLNPWCRQRVGWLEPTTITKSGTYTLRTTQLYAEAYRIDAGFPEGEYLLIENRQKIELDEKMFGDGGILIWHIDENATDFMSTPGWPGLDGWPGNGKHYAVALLSPDGRYDMETGSNWGDYSDFWANGTALEPGPARQVAVASEYDMYPNTDSYSQGIIKKTGIRLFDFSVIGETMSFQVEIPGSALPPSPSPTKSPTLPPSPSPTKVPTFPPSRSPTTSPTASPTKAPTLPPSPLPTSFPTTRAPTVAPTIAPSLSPTRSPSTKAPTVAPTVAPSTPLPTVSPTTRAPTMTPTVLVPPAPTISPVKPPTESPTVAPTPAPSSSPVKTPGAPTKLIKRVIGS